MTTEHDRQSTDRSLAQQINDLLDRPVHLYGDTSLPKITERASLRELYGDAFVDDLEALLDEHASARGGEDRGASEDGRRM